VPTSSTSRAIPEAGRALLAKHFPGAGTSATRARAAPARSLPADPVKRAQALKLELIKARHKAVPADRADAGKSVRVEQRLHARVAFAEDARYFWFRKVGTVGRGARAVLTGARRMWARAARWTCSPGSSGSPSRQA
jgi:hypothetical protein